MGKLVFLVLGAEAQLVNLVNDVTQVVAAPDLVLDLAEDLPDLVLDGIRAAGLLREATEVGEEPLIDEVAEVVADQALVVVELAVYAVIAVFWSCLLRVNSKQIDPLALYLCTYIEWKGGFVKQKRPTEKGSVVGVKYPM